MIPDSVRTCANPVSLPDRDLTQAEVEHYWSIDRANLIKCHGNNSAVVKHFDELASKLKGVAAPAGK